VTVLAEGVRAGDRRSLAQAITLVESVRPDHRDDAAALLDELLPATGGAARIAVTGSPGAGKSTFIEALGTSLAGDHAIAVLAIDPSSPRSGGSILGDKTRMSTLGRHPRTFIRPSPSGDTPGGIARRTREAMLVCEAAGFDIVVVETVGVGQSETAAADMVDCVVLVAAPGAGDELQGIKRGIMELADVIVVNKADADLLPAARRAAADLGHAAHLLRPRHPGWSVPVLLASAVDGTGIDEAWRSITELLDHLDATGIRDALRADQAVAWMWREISDSLHDALRRDDGVQRELPAIEAAVRAGSLAPSAAAQRLLAMAR
jgi:LAO/AO transport system kinase